MDKKEIIKSLIKYFTASSSTYLFIDSDYNEGMPKLVLKVISKELTKPLNISFIVPSSKYFDEVFPKLTGNINVNSKYNLGIHKLSFNIMDKSLIKNAPQESEIIIFYPCDEMKDKELIKLAENCKSKRKVIFIANNTNSPYKGLNKYNPEFISLKSSEEGTYYANMREKLFNLR